MKRNVTIILAALLAVSLTACGKSENSSATNSTNQQTSSTSSDTTNSSKPEESSTPAESSKPEESSTPTEASKPVETSEPSGDNQGSVGNAVELLTAAWDKVSEDNKFPSFGGAPGEDEFTDGVPGNFPVANPDTLEIHLGFPAASADKIDGAASLIHMMNANTFTAGAYHVKDAGTISDVTAAIENCIMSKQWMCGFPEKLVIVTVDDYIVSAFGNGELVDAFIGGLTSTYSSAKTVCDKPIELGGGDPVIGVGGGDFAIPLDWQRDENDVMYL